MMEPFRTRVGAVAARVPHSDTRGPPVFLRWPHKAAMRSVSLPDWYGGSTNTRPRVEMRNFFVPACVEIKFRTPHAIDPTSSL